MKKLYALLSPRERKEWWSLLLTLVAMIVLVVTRHSVFVTFVGLAMMLLIVFFTIGYCQEALRSPTNDNPLWLQLLLGVMKIDTVISMVFICCQWPGAKTLMSVSMLFNIACFFLCYRRDNMHALFWTLVYFAALNIINLDSL